MKVEFGSRTVVVAVHCMFNASVSINSTIWYLYFIHLLIYYIGIQNKLKRKSVKKSTGQGEMKKKLFYL